MACFFMKNISALMGRKNDCNSGLIEMEVDIVFAVSRRVGGLVLFAFAKYSSSAHTRIYSPWGYISYYATQWIVRFIKMKERVTGLDCSVLWSHWCLLIYSYLERVRNIKNNYN